MVRRGLRTWVQCGALLLLSAVGAGVHKQLQFPAMPWLRKPPPWAGAPAPVDARSIPRRLLSLEEARALVAEGALFADSRAPADYARGHLPGALPLFVLGLEENPALAGLAPDRLLICYCKGPECSVAHSLAARLEALGFRELAIFPGGVEAWQAAGLPLELGEPQEKP